MYRKTSFLQLLSSLALGLFFIWTTDDGVLSFANRLDRVPPKYRASMVEDSWEALRKRTDKRVTYYADCKPNLLDCKRASR